MAESLTLNPQSTQLSVHDLGPIDLFKELNHEEASCSISGTLVEYPKGSVMWREGDPAEHFLVVLEGTFEVYRVIQGQRLHINYFQKHMSGGEIPLLQGIPHPGNAEAVTDVKLFLITADEFWKLMGNCPTVRQRVLRNMALRNREFITLSVQRDKLMGLGTMAAGLAHELNNPASAAKRSAQELHAVLQQFDRHSSDILSPILFKNPPDPEKGYPFQILEDARQLEGVELNPMERSDREDELGDWMEGLDMEDGYDIAPTLVMVGFTQELLAEFCDQLKPEYVVPTLRWVHREVEMQLLSNELIESTKRMNELVTAMKSYSYMDRDVSMQPTDVHEGLRTTLTILHHKWKKKNIALRKELAEDLPQVMAYGGELNQVWTNLIDNAIDAMDREGTLTVRTLMHPSSADKVLVEIEDNGPGIPEEVKPRIFEPFFTTKGIGKGTGLGLEITHRIVVSRHQGDIKVMSQPGQTIFQVCLNTLSNP